MITARKNENSKPTAIVAGGAGFIGSFLCEALLLQGCRVICIDNFSSGKKDNLHQCLGKKDFIFLRQDLGKTDSLNLPIAGLYIFDLTGSALVLNKLLKYFINYQARILAVNPQPKEIISGQNLRFVYLDDVYGPRMSLIGKGHTAQLIKSAILEKKSPVFVSDVIYELIKIMFGTTQGGVIKLGESEFNRSSRVSLAEGIEQTVKYFQKDKPEKKTKQNKHLISFKKFLFILCLIFFLAISPVILLGLNFYLGVSYFKGAKEAIINGGLKKAEKSANLSKVYFQKGENLSDIIPIFGVKNIFHIGEQSTEILIQSIFLLQSSKAIFGGVVNNQNEDLDKLIGQIRIDLDQLSLKLSLMEAEIRTDQSIKFWIRLFRAENLVEQSKVYFSQGKKLVAQAQKGIDLLPILTGTMNLKTYLVLLQNSAEIRPTGGFIGSYALLAFSKGRLVGLEVKNVYEADGQLKGHVEPPPALKKHLGVASWYLRDSNWNPDFPVSAKKAIWFLEKETGETTDGVIGINLYLVKRLLSALGEIKLPDYSEKITAENLFEKAEYYSETNFFPGSTQKEDFLGGLTRALFEKIKTADEITFLKTAGAILESLTAKDLQIYLTNETAAKEMADLKMDGGLEGINCLVADNCFADYLMINEANVGVNKANYFTKRNIRHSVSLTVANEVKETVRITYQNNSQTDKFPAGHYKNYLRILTPADSELDEVKIDDQRLEDSEIDKEQISGKAVFGFLVDVPVKGEKTVIVTYRLASAPIFTGSVRYWFYWQKQSGIQDDKIELEFLPAEGMTVLSAFPAALVSGQKYQFSHKLNQDIVFNLELAK